MRNIIKVLLNEGLERDDVIAICKYIKEEYEILERKDARSAQKSECSGIDQLCKADEKRDVKGFNKALRKIRKAQVEQERLCPPPTIDDIENAQGYTYTSKGFVEADKNGYPLKKKTNDNEKVDKGTGKIVKG